MVHRVAEPQTWFSADELAIVDSFRLKKRRREWMLSRIAEKELRRRGASGAHVSYSHSGEYGAAAVASSPVGIDVEVLREIAPAAAHLFLNADEEARAARCSIPNALLHFWSAKEARWKQLGGAVATLKRVPISVIEERPTGVLFDAVETIVAGEVVVALTRPTS